MNSAAWIYSLFKGPGTEGDQGTHTPVANSTLNIPYIQCPYIEPMQR